MKLFGKTRKEEEEELPRKSLRGDRVLPKKELTEKEKYFKENKEKKKKFEIKPWGRKERYVVFGVFVSTVLASAVLGMSARQWKLPNMPRFTLPEILPSE